jgi:hypothetical protein
MVNYRWAWPVVGVAWLMGVARMLAWSVGVAWVWTWLGCGRGLDVGVAGCGQPPREAGRMGAHSCLPCLGVSVSPAFHPGMQEAVSGLISKGTKTDEVRTDGDRPTQP